MPTLAVLLPPRERVDMPGRAAAGSLGAAALAWWRLDDSGRALDQGQSPAEALPHDDSAVLLVDAADISWHRVRLPRIARSRWPQALAGMLEDDLLDDPARVHVAVEGAAVAGAQCWAVATDRPWLAQQLQALQRAGIHAQRVAPLAWPTEAGVIGHFDLAQAGGNEALRLTLRSPGGVACLPLAGAAGAVLLGQTLHTAQGEPPTAEQPAAVSRRWTAIPAATQAAERMTGEPVTLVTAPDLIAQALQSPWNLLQFDLAPQRAASRRLGRAWQALRSPAWQPARWGLLGLAGLHLLGIGVGSWQASQQIEQHRAEQVQLLRETFPEVRAVLDAPRQMQRLVEPLRRAAGQPDPRGFERALEAAAGAWPAGAAPASAISFDQGRLQLGTPRWSAAEHQAFAQALRGSGWSAQSERDGVVLLAQATRGNDGPR